MSANAGEEVGQTNVQSKTVEPRWEASYLLSVEPRRANTLRLELYNRERKGGFLGQATVVLGDAAADGGPGEEGVRTGGGRRNGGGSRSSSGLADRLDCCHRCNLAHRVIGCACAGSA